MPEITFEGIDLTWYQEEFMYCKERFTFVDASSKAGKASAMDAKVYTPEGYKLMKDINLGDEILTIDGTCHVIGVYPQGIKDIYRVTFSDGSSTEVSEDHLWDIKRSAESYKYKNDWRTVSTRDILNISEGQRRYYKIPMIDHAHFNERSIKIDPYLLGVLLGDGGLSQSSIRFSTNDPEILNSVNRRSTNDYFVRHIAKYDYVIKQVSPDKLESQTLPSIIREYGLNVKSHQKFIPEDYKYNTVEVRKQILRGIFDTDGYIDKHGHIRLEQTSKQLADDVKEIVQSLGGQVKQTYKENNGYKKDGVFIKCKPSYRQGIIFRDPREYVTLARHLAKCKIKKKPINRNIKSIVLIGQKDCQCIQVSDKSQLYITDEFIVTHNTMPLILWILQLSCNEDPVWNWDDVDGKNFWWVAPVSSQASIAYNRLQGIVKNVPGFKCIGSPGKEKITTPLGSIIWFKTAEKPDSLYGEDVYGAVLDEHSRCKQASYTALQTTTTATGAPIKLIGNYKGAANWSSIMKKKCLKDPNWKVMTIPANVAVEAGIIEQSSLDAIETTMPKADFRAVYYCEGSVDQYRIFDSNSIENFYTNKFLIKNNDSTMYMCCDLAYLGADFFKVHVWRGSIRIKKFKFEKTGGKEIVGHIQKIADDYGVMRSNIVVDGTGAQWLSSSDGESGFMDGVKMFVGGERANDPVAYFNKRAENFYLLAAALRQGKLWSQDDTDKESEILELEAQRRKDAPRGRIMMEKKTLIKGILGGASPDDADTLSMRMEFPIGAPTNLPKESSGVMSVSY